ncbi:MAG: cation diffusion facilitator family transporter [Thermomonas sp.]
MSASGDSTRAILFALAANFAIACAKGVAAFFTGSSAMMAETVHSLADCGNQLLLLLGLRQSRRPPTPDYPLGFGKEIYFWSFLVAVMLFSVGGMYSLYEGWHKLSSHEALDVQKLWWAVAVLVFAIGAEGMSMRACMQEIDKARGDQNLWRWFRVSRQAELIVIFGEDLAALAGLVLALAAVLLTMATGNPLWDALGTLAIGILLIIVAVFVAREVKAMLIGQSMEPERQAALRAFLEARPEVEFVISLISLQLGNDVMVSVQAQMAEDQSARALVEQINCVEREMKQAFPDVKWSFFEPELSRTPD